MSGKLGKHRSAPIIVDCDGVVADFVGAVMPHINEKYSKALVYEDIIYDIREFAGGKWDEESEEWIRQPGFAQKLDELPGAVEAIQEIREDFDVVFVTSPYHNSPTWCFDRYVWLADRFAGLSRDDVIFAHDKRFVHGAILIDDRWENVVDWSIYQKKTSLLFSQPWNGTQREEFAMVDGALSLIDLRRERRASIIPSDNWSKIHKIIEITMEEIKDAY